MRALLVSLMLCSGCFQPVDEVEPEALSGLPQVKSWSTLSHSHDGGAPYHTGFSPGPSEAWVVAWPDGLLHLSGGSSAFQKLTLPSNGAINGIDGAFGELWVVGTDLVNPFAMRRRDGTAKFTSVNIPKGGVDARRVFVAAPNDVWVAGGNDEPHGCLLRRWTGAWQTPQQTCSSPVLGLFARGRDDLWLTLARSTLSHVDARVSLELESPAPLKRAVWAEPLAAAVWVAAERKQVFRYDGQFTRYAMPFEVNALWGTGHDDLWAGGTGLAHFDGEKWSTVALERPFEIYELFGQAADDVWAVGKDATVLHYAEGLEGAFCASDRNCNRGLHCQPTSGAVLLTCR